ncbi:hypothetical protein GW926_00425 [Candidatus Pacearchaeota archaeon]|nr:hypothetical protein [Candidatus Pacearchaeota archaeon]
MTNIATVTGRGQITIPTSITDVMGLYASVNPKGRSLLSSIDQAKKIKAKKTASQTYE